MRNYVEVDGVTCEEVDGDLYCTIDDWCESTGRMTRDEVICELEDWEEVWDEVEAEFETWLEDNDVTEA